MVRVSAKALSNLCNAAHGRWRKQRVAMGEQTVIKRAALGALALQCAACAAPGLNAPSIAGAPPDTPSLSVPKDPQSRASRLAITLAQGEAAYTKGDKARLGEIVASLKASGLRMFDASEKDTLAMWQSVSAAEPTPFRGRLLGPAYVRGELAPGEIWRSAQTFKSGETSTLSVSHKGDGPVRMKVSDTRARAVCNPSAMAGPPCRFTPMFTQRYEIELKNEGDENAVYFLVFD